MWLRFEFSVIAGVKRGERLVNGVIEKLLTVKSPAKCGDNTVPSYLIVEGVTTIGDECSQVGWGLPPLEAPRISFVKA